MEKEHPSSSSPTSEKTQKYSEQSNTASFKSETTYTAVKPQKPPRSRKKIIDKTQHDPMTGVHAEKTQHWSKAAYLSDHASLNLETTHTTAVTPQKAPLSQEEMINKVKNDPAVRVCAEKVQRWSKTVYGNSNVLNAEINNILKNPAAKNPLLRTIKENPTSIHRLAGAKILGLKTNARRESERSLPYLCSAIRVYAEAVCQTYEGTNITATIEDAAVGKNLQKSLSTETAGVSLSNERVTSLVQSSPSVQRYYQRIEHWSQVVYGKSNVFQKQMEDMLDDPTIVGQLLWDIARKPHSFHKIAGHKIGSFKDNARRCAENSLTHLRDAFKNYADVITQTKESILQGQEIQQKDVNISKSQKKEVIQERHHTQQRGVQQHKVKGGKGMALAL
ncbi:BID domain-containing T4SS effector [Bartonella taylorii]|uniref:BID domain-containing T4SS effector n=1 Tax=Bartonella taylorii TaxID=33046 RepID=UPI001ABB6614|nr:BID domain-containing T4SS effector [Bartonella taylorii]